MSEVPRCRDCGHPVGWNVNEGECPRDMQNSQSPECKDRQIAWLKAQLAAALKCVDATNEHVSLRSISEYDLNTDAKAELDRVLRSPT